MPNAAEILKKPYARVVIPDSDGSYFAEIMEFPGCFASGATAADALSTLEEVAVSWLDAVIEKGQSVPEPIDIGEFSGKLVLRLPKSLHKKASLLAKREGVSLNHFIVGCLSETVGAQLFIANFHTAAANVQISGSWNHAGSYLQEITPSIHAFASVRSGTAVVKLDALFGSHREMANA